MSTAATDASGGGNPSALPPGTRLAEFEIRQVVGIGGFGIVYLAFDHALEREVAIKEYMPSSLVGRTATMHVSLRSQADSETFDIGLRSFVNEARLLASFDHPSLLKVLRFWEANGTAYMAMPVLRGQTLKQLRQNAGSAPEEAWMRGLLASMLDALERLHGAHVYHRDISPDNIQIEPDGRAVLLDFGAARRVASDKSQNLTAILKPAYAPVEQYGEAGSVKQGPWTDFYALGATLHFLLLGRPPAPATARMLHDDSPSLVDRAPAGVGSDWLRLLDWMLAPKPADRPQSVAELRDVLHGRRTLPEPQQPPAAASQGQDADFDRTVVMARPQALAAMASATASPAPRSAAAAGPRRPMAVWLGGGLVALLALAAAAFAWLPSADTSTPPTVAQADPASPDPAPAQALPTPGAESRPAPAPEDLAAQPAMPASQAQPAGVAASVPGPGRGAGETPAITPAAALPASSPRPAQPGAGLAAAESPSTPVRTARPVETRPAVTLPAPAPVVPARKRPENELATPTPPGQTATGAGAGTGMGGALQPPSAQPAPAAPTEPTRTRKAPLEVCKSKPHLLYFGCMERECWRSENHQHADCLKWRKDMPSNN